VIFPGRDNVDYEVRQPFSATIPFPLSQEFNKILSIVSWHFYGRGLPQA